VLRANLITLSVFVALMGWNSNLFASVWEDNNQWNQEWERKLSTWMKSGAVHSKMFSDKSSNYYGVRADCADASYALRIIFSYENQLPFKMRNPSGSRRGQNRYLTNQISKFDRTSNLDRRVVSFINYIAGIVGTESLVRNDTFSPSLKSIRAGDLFMYMSRGRWGKSIRHSYNIKRVNPTGDFALIYSTQALARARKPMNLREHRMFSHAPHNPWGFRRFKWPRLASVDPVNYPPETGYSLEQFSLVKELGSKKFFKYVSNLLKSSDLMPGELLETKLSGLCKEAQARIEYVNQGVDHANRTNWRCMNYADFDAYSTPSRDALLVNLYQQLRDEYYELKERGDLDLADVDLVQRVEEIFAVVDQQDSSLQAFCPITYRPDVTIDLAELYRRQQDGVLSSHPNDRLGRRWGEGGDTTSCRRWY
jgi:hypothetical protein